MCFGYQENSEKIGKNIISIYHEKIGQRKRLLAKCLLCCEFEEAKKFSKNGLVYIAHGVRCDTEEKIMKIIDHLFSNSHQAVAEAKELIEMGKSRYESSMVESYKKRKSSYSLKFNPTCNSFKQ